MGRNKEEGRDKGWGAKSKGGMDKERGEGQRRGGTRKGIGSSGGHLSPCEGAGAGHIHHCACGRSWMVVGCWSLFFDRGGGGRLWWSGARLLSCVWALVDGGGVTM